MKYLSKLSYALIIALSFVACQNEKGKNYNAPVKVDEDGLKFIKNGIEGAMTEVKASGLAITNSNNQRVISFAKMMIEDHTNADSSLKKIEADKAVDLKDTINATHLHLISALSKKTGRDFDKAYMTMMAADHETVVELFSNGSKNTDVAISKFAAATLPVVKMHLDSAKAVLASLK